MSEIKKTTSRVANIQEMPLVSLQGLVVFPKVVIHFETPTDEALNALVAASKSNSNVFITASKHYDDMEDDDIHEVYTVGVVATVKQILKTSFGPARVVVEGLYRGKITNLHEGKDYPIVEVRRYADKGGRIPENEMEAICRAVKDEFKIYSKNMPKMPEDYIKTVLYNNDPRGLFNDIVISIPIDFRDKQKLLECDNYTQRLLSLVAILSKESQILNIESDIQQKLRTRIDNSQKEFFLREHIHALQAELGEDNIDDEYEYTQKILELDLAPKTEEKLLKEARRLSMMSPSSQEAFVIKNYLDTVLELPWNTSSDDITSIKKVETVLDRDHYGLKKVKERILENIAVLQLTPDVKGQIICLYGPPGVGKTSIAKSIASSLGRKYVRVSLGGVRDESDIRGHRKTYVGAMAGRIISAMIEAGTNNPLILLDEIDKISLSVKGDPSAALLEVLDSEQNQAFRDHYVEVPFDLSKVMFMTTANNIADIDPPLRDRMEIIELNSYTFDEKFNIAKKHLIPKQLEKYGMTNKMVVIRDAAIREIIDGYTREAGVRQLERIIASLCRKSAKELLESFTEAEIHDKSVQTKVVITVDSLNKYLGNKKYTSTEMTKTNEVGVVNGLAWTSVGGVIMPLEVLIMEGKGGVLASGSLGKVMKESSDLAVSYVRSIAHKYGIDEEFYKKTDIHIHAPEGAVHKDGPSAGVTMTTALVSALSGIPVRKDVAMTGEITLHGNVLAIGGLREKTMAAYKEGIKTVIIPYANKGDLDEVEDVVKENIEFVLAKNIADVLDVALVKAAPIMAGKKSTKEKARQQ